jgi:ribosome biogenesis GTPase / thiamine phosphate phosphatase
MTKLIGKVLKSTGKWYIVEFPDGEIVNCMIRGKIRMSGLKTTNPIAVGDRVLLSDWRDDEGKGLIENFEKRDNYIVRKSTNLSKQMQILAANVDTAYMIVTLAPETHLAFIDRFLVAAESYHINAELLFNKMDTYNEAQLAEIDYIIAIYESIGYKCHKISAEKKENIEFLKEEINGKQIMVTGHSGAGKSTLVNALDTQFSIKTKEISAYHQQGQHTTTFAEMHKLSTGGYIIDTPGIRAFGVVDLDKAIIWHYFPEMRELKNECKYHNCQHLEEPKCAVKAAVEAETIPFSRYNTYLQLVMEDPDDAYRRNIYG